MSVVLCSIAATAVIQSGGGAASGGGAYGDGLATSASGMYDPHIQQVPDTPPLFS